MSDGTEVTEIRAAAMSTYQDNADFEFSRVKQDVYDRRHLGPKMAEDQVELESQISKYYHLEELAAFLRGTATHKGYKNVTLQFPDLLVCDSATVVHEIQRRLKEVKQEKEVDNESCQKEGCKEESSQKECCKEVSSQKGCCQTGKACCDATKTSGTRSDDGQKVWILADTSYSPCCVDEVAAEHVHSDLVVHFGDACLNTVAKLPVAYVLGTPHLDIDKVVTLVKEQYSVEDQILLMADATHTPYLKNIHAELVASGYNNCAYADLFTPSVGLEIIGYTPTSEGAFPLDELNRQFVALTAPSSLSEWNLFHISQPAAPRLLQLTTKFQSVVVYDTADEKISTTMQPNLMRRYRFVNVARTAGTVGLLVNTLSLANTKTLLNKLIQRIKDAGKKHYVFVVGKPNVAKLANFENIDVWCVLGCDHQGIILDQTNEYFKPIVTPSELLLSLSDELTWTGEWVTNFKEVIKRMEEEDGNQDTHEEESQDPYDSDEAPEFDPVTGKYVSTSRPLRRLQHLQVTAEEEQASASAQGLALALALEALDSGSLVKRFSNTVAIKNTVSTSAIHLQTRTWTGLGSDFQEEGVDEEGALVEEGRGGVARGYDFDREAHK